MDYLASLQILVNIFLLAAIVYFLNGLRKERRLVEESRDLVRRMSDLREALNQLVWQAGGVSRKIAEARDAPASQHLKELAELRQTVSHIEAEIDHLRTALNKSSPYLLMDKYSDAIRLAETGLSAEEISRKINIPLGEVELALSLRK